MGGRPLHRNHHHRRASRRDQVDRPAVARHTGQRLRRDRFSAGRPLGSRPAPRRRTAWPSVLRADSFHPRHRRLGGDDPPLGQGQTTPRRPPGAWPGDRRLAHRGAVPLRRDRLLRRASRRQNAPADTGAYRRVARTRRGRSPAPHDGSRGQRRTEGLCHGARTGHSRLHRPHQRPGAHSSTGDRRRPGRLHASRQRLPRHARSCRQHPVACARDPRPDLRPHPRPLASVARAVPADSPTRRSRLHLLHHRRDGRGRCSARQIPAWRAGTRGWPGTNRPASRHTEPRRLRTHADRGRPPCR